MLDWLTHPILIQSGLSALQFTAVVLVVWTVFGYPTETGAPQERQLAAALGRDRHRTLFDQGPMRPMTALAVDVARRMRATRLRRWIREQLDAAGNPSGYTVDEYLALSLMSGAGFALGLGLLSVALRLGVGPGAAALAAGVGFAAPLWALREAARSRVQRISKALPYTLDLIALMMASGATFNEAVQSVLRDPRDDDFSDELRMVQSEIALGANRASALRNMASRIPLETLRSVVGAINQAESLGTPLSDILKNQADILRMHRSVRAEKLSASASLRILLPTMLILIAVVLIIFGPMVIRYYRGELF